jgi:hypothetical protein
MTGAVKSQRNDESELSVCTAPSTDPDACDGARRTRGGKNHDDRTQTSWKDHDGRGHATRQE